MNTLKGKGIITPLQRKLLQDIASHPVVEIDAKILKKTFLELSREIMDRIKE